MVVCPLLCAVFQGKELLGATGMEGAGRVARGAEEEVLVVRGNVTMGASKEAGEVVGGAGVKILAVVLC